MSYWFQIPVIKKCLTLFLLYQLCFLFMLKPGAIIASCDQTFMIEKNVTRNLFQSYRFASTCFFVIQLYSRNISKFWFQPSKKASTSRSSFQTFFNFANLLIKALAINQFSLKSKFSMNFILNFSQLFVVTAKIWTFCSFSIRICNSANSPKM